MKLHRRYIIPFLAAATAACSCSMLSYVPAGEYALTKNEIHVLSDSFEDATLGRYLSQQQTPFLVFGGEPVIFREEAVKESEESLRSHMEYMGWYGSKVEGKVSKRGKKVRVSYEITPGKRFRIHDITYSLPDNDEFAADFYADTCHTIVRKGYYLSERRLAAESERCASHLRTEGYYGITDRNFFFEADTLDSDAVTLEIAVRGYGRDESERDAKPIRKYRIGDVTISRDADMVFRDDVLKSLNTITPGSLYDESVINTTYARLASLRSFSNVSISLKEKSDSALVDCDISLDRSKMQGFKANLEASLNSSGLLGISPQLNFFHRNFFHGGEVLNLGFMGNFQFQPNSDVRANEYGISLGLTFPRFLGLPYSRFKGSNIPSTDIKASYNFQDRPEYTRSIVSASFGYSGILNGHMTYQLYPVQINMVRLDNLDEAFSASLSHNPYMRYAYQNHFDAGLGGLVYLASDMSLNPAGSYRYARLSFDLSGNLIGLMNDVFGGNGQILGTPFTQYVRSELTLGNTLRFASGMALAGRIMAGAGYAYGNSTTLPYEKQFYCGGASSMRGWQVRAVGPGSAPMDTGFIIPSQTGDMKVEANLELRYHLFWKLEGALFADAGNVWNMADLKDEPIWETLAADWGTGIRCDLNFIVIRVDAGFKAYDPSLSPGARWKKPSDWISHDGFAIHFGVGYPF